MARHIKNITLATLALCLLLVGCRPWKALQSHEETTGTMAYIASLPAVTPDTTALQHITGNATFGIYTDGNEITLKGKLRIKRGEGIQLSITPFGLVEAACIEFLPDKVRLINKMTKSYTELPYSLAGAIGLGGINYGIVEALLLNYTFLPDGRPAYKGLKGMKIEELESQYILITKGKDAMQYSFAIDKESGNLVSCSGTGKTGESIKCDYSGFADIGDISFPGGISIGFTGDTTMKLDLKLNKTNNKPFNFSSRSTNSSYRKQGIVDFINSIK